MMITCRQHQRSRGGWATSAPRASCDEPAGRRPRAARAPTQTSDTPSSSDAAPPSSCLPPPRAPLPIYNNRRLGIECLCPYKHISPTLLTNKCVPPMKKFSPLVHALIGPFFSSPCYFHISEVIHQLVKIWHLHGGLKDTVDHCCNNGHGPQAAGPQEVHRVHGCCHYRAARHGLCCQASADVYPAQYLTENADCISTKSQYLPQQSRLLITGRKQSMACYMKF